MILPSSTTQLVPEVQSIPQHIAIIMDGNGRWAAARRLPRVAGHERGLAALRKTVEASVSMGIKALTVFAFSSENWRRPEEEVSFLMALFLRALRREVKELHRNGIELRIIGDIDGFSEPLRQAIHDSVEKTRGKVGLVLTVAVNYGGRWDLLNAVNEALERARLDQQGEVLRLTEDAIRPYLALSDLPEPDLFIRTGGEQRISNFMIWQLAYTELFFTNAHWPDFDGQALCQAIESYQMRERRFGRTSGQLASQAASGSTDQAYNTRLPV